jgi:hypothetical protein
MKWCVETAKYCKVWKSRSVRQEGLWHAWERNELHLQFWLGNLKGKKTYTLIIDKY